MTAGTPAGDEFPEGIVVPVDPGAFPGGRARRPPGPSALRCRPPRADLRPGPRPREGASRSRLARSTASPRFLGAVVARAPEIQAALAADRAEEGTLLGYLMEEVRWGARDLGLPGAPLDLTPLLEGLLGRRAVSAPELSVVIPAFNEERRLPATLESVVEYLRPRGTLVRGAGGRRRIHGRDGRDRGGLGRAPSTSCAGKRTAARATP